jgi:YHS domain-containing protein
MKIVKRMICLWVMVIFVSASPILAAAGSANGNSQEKCPVMAGKIDKSSYLDHQGKRIYFCCAACPAEFKKDPAKYMKQMEEQGVVLEDAPKTN